MPITHLLLVAFAVPLALQAQAPAGPPCRAAEHRQFDFWIGDWDVQVQGRTMARNVIDSAFGGCVVRENYTVTGRPYAGSSLNVYDAARSVWHQTWVDNQGALLLLEGGLQGGAMVMEGTTPGSRGPVRNRITWTPVARDSVRQHWQAWSDSANTWVTAFDGLYVRRRP